MSDKKDLSEKSENQELAPTIQEAKTAYLVPYD